LLWIKSLRLNGCHISQTATGIPQDRDRRAMRAPGPPPGAPSYPVPFGGLDRSSVALFPVPS
jgi:hypothetical protein